MFHMVAQVDTEEIGRMTAPRESALLGFLLSSHVIKLITSYLEDRDPLKRRLESIEMNWQMRLKLLGELGHSGDGSYVPNVVITELRMTAVTLENDCDIVKQEIVHDTNSKDMQHICPDNLLDFLLVFLECVIKSILPRIPDKLRYKRWSEECLTEARELVTNLRTASFFATDVPTRASDTSISDMFFYYKYLPADPDSL